MSIKRKLAAIMFTDIVSFTKIMGSDESTAIEILQKQQSLFAPILDKHEGNIVKKMGDGMLIDFPSTVEGVECAMEMQDSILEYNNNNPENQFHIRIGIHLGDVVMMGDDILGDGVNIASRIEPLASPDGICLTEVVYQSVKSKLNISPKRISEVDLKNIDDKYTIYKLPGDDSYEGMDKEESTTQAEKSKIEITNYELVSNLPHETIKSILQAFVVAFFIHPFFNLIDILFEFFLNTHPNFFEDFKLFPTTLEPQWALFFSFIGKGVFGLVFFVLMMGFIMGLFLRKKEERISFADIRNVDTLLDYMVSDISVGGTYEIIEKTGNSITYFPYARSIFGKFEKLLTKIIPLMENSESLILTFDGNTVAVRGAWHAVNKLKKKLKILEIV